MLHFSVIWYFLENFIEVAGAIVYEYMNIHGNGYQGPLYGLIVALLGSVAYRWP